MSQLGYRNWDPRDKAVVLTVQPRHTESAPEM